MSNHPQDIASQEDSRSDQTSSAIVQLVSAASVKQACGDVSDMTLWRWLQDENLNFPKPIYIQRRRFWRADELVLWIENQPREMAQSA